MELSETESQEMSAEFPQLMPWDPRDWWRILSWLFFAPRKWNAYEKQDKQTLFDTARWLLNTLAWLPLILLLVGSVVGTVRTYSVMGSLAVLVIAIGVWRTTIALDMQQVKNRLVSLAVVVAVLVIIIAANFQIVLFITVLPAVLLINGMVFGIAQLLDIQGASVVTRIMAVGLFPVIVGETSILLAVVEGIIAYAVVAGIASVVRASIKNQIRFTILGLVVKALFFVLIAACLFLIWRIFLGGTDTVI